MSFKAAITYIPQIDPSTFLINDVSNYALPDDKGNISSRVLIIFQSDGTPLSNYPNPIAWPYSSGDSLLFQGLTRDLALQITMVLVPVVSIPNSVYTTEADIATTGFLQQGLYNIQVARLNNTNPSSLSDKVYRANSIDLLIEGQNSQTGVLYANFTGAQEALDRSKNIITNTQL